VIRNIEQFDARHGGADAAVEDNRWYLFPDGAEREVYLDFSAVLKEPPTDPVELAKAKRRYAELRYMQAREDFLALKVLLHNAAKEAVMHARATTPPPAVPNEQVAKLKELQQLAIKRQAEYQAADKAVADARPAWVKARDEQAEAVLPALTETQRIIDEMNI
jgi:hypothetical protein